MAYEQTFENVILGNNPVLQEDLILPVQFKEMFQATRWTPEKRLLLAILVDALHCYQGVCTDGSHNTQQAQKEAALWFLDKSDYPFAFEGICAELGEHPDILRRNLGVHTPRRPLICYRGPQSVTV